MSKKSDAPFPSTRTDRAVLGFLLALGAAINHAPRSKLLRALFVGFAVLGTASVATAVLMGPPAAPWHAVITGTWIVDGLLLGILSYVCGREDAEAEAVEKVRADLEEVRGGEAARP